MEMTTIHVMRHGEVHNPEGILYGRRPGYHLSDLGQQMAAGVAEVLQAGGHDIRAVIASPLLRAQQTAAPTARAFGLPIYADERLIEAGNDFEGAAVNKNRLMLAHPENWTRYRNPMEPSWGEPYVEQVARMSRAVAHALKLARGGEALLVSHQLPIWCLRLFAQGRPLAHDPRRRQCSLASLTSLVFSKNTLVGVYYSEPVAQLLANASDMVPGSSGAQENRG